MEHLERLARSGVEHSEAALAVRGHRLVVMDDAEPDDDLARDVAEVLTSERRGARLCARRYGQHSARRHAEAALGAAGAGR